MTKCYISQNQQFKYSMERDLNLVRLGYTHAKTCQSGALLRTIQEQFPSPLPPYILYY